MDMHRASLGALGGDGLYVASVIYGYGYNSCDCTLRLPEVRSGSCGVDLGPAWGPKSPKQSPKRPQATPTGPSTGNYNRTDPPGTHLPSDSKARYAD
jgi:hypothetical protein